ncbi:MAG: hypothetical protein K2X86_15075 [Cytophagaceae bacterium]|nr:hypothetical protein [Cytophagaceae bacterium]
MKKIFQYISLLLITGTIIFSCKKYDDEFYGPAMGMAPSNFSVSGFSPSNSNPNFASGSVYFQSTFNATVRWTITLTGQTSGAIKTIEGVSNVLDASTASWDGSTDTLKLFVQSETVTAELSILGWPQTYTTTLTVGTEKNRGIIIGSFENITVDQVAKNFQDPSGLWWFFNFDNTASGNEYDMVDKIADPGTPHGIHSLKISGHDANVSYYIGKAGVSPSGAMFNFGPTTLNDFYFNVYVKGAGTALSASGMQRDYKLVIETFEDDMGNGLQYNGTEDNYTYTVDLNYDGWKLYSVKYSNFILGNSAASPYKSHSPDKIANIGFFIGANTAAGLSATDVIDTQIDYFTITTNGSMIP